MKIEKIELFVTDLPHRLKRTFHSGSWDTGAPGSLLGKPVLIKIHSDGLTGYGQIRPISPSHFMPDTVGSVLAAVRDAYGPLMIGQSAFDLGRIFDSFDQRLPRNMNARALIDHGLHDLIGKGLGVPVYTLLGGAAQERLPLEWSVSLAQKTSTMVDEARRAVEEFGIRIIGLKAAGPEGWRQDVTNFAQVREAVGDDVEMGVDPNTGWSVADTIRAVNELRNYRIDSVEQPVERDDVIGLRRIRDALSGIAVLADESLSTVQDAYRLVRHDAVDAFVLKLYKVGGIRAAQKIAAIAEAANVRINMGGLAAFSQLEAAASAHFLASQSPQRTIGGVEFVFGLGVIGPDPLAPEQELTMSDGFANVPRGPGLGITIDDNAVERLALHHEIIDSRDGNG